MNCFGIRISVLNCVVFPNPAWILGRGILGVNVWPSWWYPHCQMVRDFWESTCSTPSGILIFRWRGVSRRLRVVPPVVSWFPNLVVRGILSVSDNNNFVTQQPPRNDYGYRAHGELSHFVYCLLQKIKASGSLPVIEKWENYMPPNHSSFKAIEEEHFLVGTRVHATLEKMNSQYLKKEFRGSARRFLEEFTSTVLSTVAARSRLGQGVSCFCPEITIGGDDHSAFFLFGQLLDGLVACGWEKGSTVEACKAELQSFVNDQRQLECNASRKHSDMGSVVTYLSHQSGFRSRRHLYRVNLVGFRVDSVAPVKHLKLL